MRHPAARKLTGLALGLVSISAVVTLASHALAGGPAPILRSTSTPVAADAAHPRDDAAGADFSAWGVLLARYVDSRGQVDYQTWKTRDEGTLDRIIAALARATPDQLPSPADRLAFWINSYNAVVVNAILKRYPIQSVQAVSGFFTQKAWTIAGTTISLDEIENTKIRPVFKEPRVHFALVCGARSCPRLLAKEYAGSALSMLLDNQARTFLSDPAKNRFDAVAGRAQVSSIFRWYEGDFTTNGSALIDFVRRFAPLSAQPLLARPDVQLEFLPYDWSLNERPTAGSGEGGHVRD